MASEINIGNELCGHNQNIRCNSSNISKFQDFSHKLRAILPTLEACSKLSNMKTDIKRLLQC